MRGDIGHVESSKIGHCFVFLNRHVALGPPRRGPQDPTQPLAGGSRGVGRERGRGRGASREETQHAPPQTLRKWLFILCFFCQHFGRLIAQFGVDCFSSTARG